MTQQEPTPSRLMVDCLGKSLYVVEDPETGMKSAGRDFEQVKARVLESARHVRETGGIPAAGVGMPATGKLGVRRSLFDTIGTRFVFFVPVVLILILIPIVTSVKSIEIDPFHWSQTTTEESVFRKMRKGVFSVNRALHEIQPENRRDLLQALHSIAVSLRPYLDQLKPLFSDKPLASSTEDDLQTGSPPAKNE